MNDFEKRLDYDLKLRIDQGIFREVSLFNDFVDFYSNDYLGLACLGSYSNKKSIGSSRLIGGTSASHIRLENKLADYFNTDAALCFNSGYAANIGVISSLCKKDDVILYDSACHSSIKDGIKLSYAKSFKFKHNSVDDLERLLKSNSAKHIFIITEGLFSMLGDFPPLDTILFLAEKYKAKVIIDEAHSAGLFGENGKGVVSNYSNARIVAKIVTFGKAFGSHGAAVLCSKKMKDYLINFSRTFIYTTALPSLILEKTESVLEPHLINQKRTELDENIQLFNKLTLKINNVSHPNSPIKIIVFDNKEKLKLAEKELQRQGLGVKAIYSPTVPKGQECLRIIIHSFNSETEIKSLCNLLLSNCTFIKDNVTETQL